MTSRYWGEEKQADVHYEVYLKKVCYHSDGRHWKSSHQNAKLTNCAVAKSRLNVLRYNLFNGWTDRDVEDDRLEWETIKIRVIKAATLQKWVLDMVLIEDDCARGYLFELFFETYRAVATPMDVLRIILSDLQTLLNDNGRVRRTAQCQWKFQTWCTVLRRWLGRYPEDFDEYPKYTCLGEIVEFSRKNNDVLDLLAEKATTMRSQFTRQIMLPKCTISFVQNGLLSADMLDYVGNCTMSRHLDLTHMDPLYIAEQLTCIDADLFKRLICYQCQSYFWSRRFKSSSAGDCVNTVRATVDQFNALARRVMASVVYNIHEKAYYRAKVICCWILVAQVVCKFRLAFQGIAFVEKFQLTQSDPVRFAKRTRLPAAQRLVARVRRRVGLFPTVVARVRRRRQQRRHSEFARQRGDFENGRRLWRQNQASQIEALPANRQL
ncbi:conserved hypothetical protein [Trichinella spiralis]|uniref:hypothetical protein n=1 Tax=Trichinella spiralis TaxID=6334 RepID=UPI0001EFB79D|nr:conserved hypothetical protein [Trichinella spiralis]